MDNQPTRDEIIRANPQLGRREKCYECKGKGEVTLTVHNVSERTTDSFTTTCLTCKGSKYLPKGSKAAHDKAVKEFWCSCPNGGAPGEFHDDGTCSKCDKHHCHCAACGKIQQVG